MTAFDGNEYRKRVMARLLADFSAADPEAGDPFFVVDIDPGATDAQIRERLTQVKAFWQKERNSPKYKAVAAQLVQRYPQYEAVLLDARARGVASARVQGQRGAADAEGIANLDRLAAILARKHQGVPRSKVPLLTAAADRRGVSPAGFAAWLKSITIIDIIDGSETLPWDKGVRTDVRTALDELARTTGDQRRYTTLWTFLGVTPSVPVAQLTRVHERLLAENQAGRQDRIRTRTADLLAHVKTRLLVDGGAESYAATMRADARDLIVPEVEEIGLLAGELGPAEAATLQARIASLGWGITPAEANELVLEVSRSLGIASLVDVDFVLVVCAKCGKAQQAGTRKTCKYCRADLYISCPRCAKQVEAAAHLCPYCNVDIAGQRKRQELIAEATDALSHGQPVHARQLADKAHELSHGQQVTSGTPDALAMGLHALRTDITTRLEAADAKRAAVKNAINTHHWWAAAHDLDWLMREASDVSPDFPAQRELVAQHQADALARLSTVAREHPQDEAAAAAIVRDFPDCVAAADRLASFPLEAPSHFGAQVMDETVHLSWSRVPGRDISYVIKRTSSEGEKVIARTSSVSVEDGGAPTGDPLTYAVSAVSGKRSSPPVAAEPVVLLRDITAVSWRDEDSAVLLTWPPLAGKANVLIERTTDDPAEIVTTKRMRAKRGANTHVDPSAIPGRDYQYRVYPEYLLSSNERVALNGASVNVHLALKAKAVTDFHVSATLEGTALNYPRV
ncbi:MAG: hypothetical protein QG597_1482, partial [Actinomycetota bacterium]|nr:hypothetical protein [Actinomycetota bacterium]